MNLQFFGITIHPYGFILGLGILASLELSLRLAKERKIDSQLIEKLFIWVLVGGVIGARLYHVIDKWGDIYSTNPLSVLFLWNGGLGIWGAIIGGLVGLFSGLYFYKGKFSLNLLDVACFGVPVGQAIGRWGNFFNNEIVGSRGEPLFLYESLLNLVLFALIFYVAKTTETKGKISGLYLMGYGYIRLVLEPLRPESIIWKISGVPTASLISIVTICLGFFIWNRRQS